MKWYIKDGQISKQESDGASVFEVEDHATEITIPDGVTEIDSFTFAGCTSLTRVIIPDSVTEIGQMAFKRCTNLTSIVIPDSVIEIGELAFTNCKNLKKVVIPCDAEVGEYTFIGCTSLYE